MCPEASSSLDDEIPVGQLIGYARVSTASQDLALQRDALERAGCDRIYDDMGSGSIRHRPELDACLDYLRAGTRWLSGGWIGWAGA
jgi:DNA invertase Pin-like site-specific DNA recombinase